MDFKDRVKKYTKKKEEPKKRNDAEYKKRENFIRTIEAKVGTLKSVQYDKIDTNDLFKLANALSGHVRI